MRKEGTVILDYDGVGPDLEAREPAYFYHYVVKLASEIKINESELAEKMAAAKGKILQAPREQAWMENGVRVCGATEPTIVVYLAAREVLAGLSEKSLRIPKGKELTLLFNRVYHHSRNLMETKFHPGFETFVVQLQELARVVIVSGTPEEVIRRETNQLMPGNNLEIEGGVKKSRVEPNWSWEGKIAYSSIWPVNYPAEVDLRRPDLYRAWQKYQNIRLVVGDLPEMELLTAEAAGLDTALKLTGYTQSWEKDYHQNGAMAGRFLIDSFDNAIGVIGGVI